ncbi:MAG: winged helix-turn-helix domain-containing protein [Phycisphaerales bacterium]
MNTQQKTPDNTLARASTADHLSVLSNPIRLEILTALANAEKCVSDIARELQLDASTVSHSLSLLGEKPLVQHTPVDKRHIYRLSNAVEASVDGPIVCFVVTTDAGEHLAFETRNR